MCLPNFIEFKQIDQSEPLIGYRNWKKEIKSSDLVLKSSSRGYVWQAKEGPHEVLDNNSGIYAYNNYYYYYYYNYNNNYNYYYYNYIAGIIKQYGKVAIHKNGYRSEYAHIDTLFTIRESDAQGSQKFLDWIKQFNELIEKIATNYNAKTIHYQDFKRG